MAVPVELGRYRIVRINLADGEAEVAKEHLSKDWAVDRARAYNRMYKRNNFDLIMVVEEEQK